MSGDLYPPPRRRPWAEEMDALAAAARDWPPLPAVVPAAPAAPVPVPIPVRAPRRKRTPAPRPPATATIRAVPVLTAGRWPGMPTAQGKRRPPVGPIPATPGTLADLGELIGVLAAALLAVEPRRRPAGARRDEAA